MWLEWWPVMVCSLFSVVWRVGWSDACHQHSYNINYINNWRGSSHWIDNTYLVMGLLMTGNLLGTLFAHVGGVDAPVPHLGGRWQLQWPFEGNICRSVDHSSHRDEGWEVWMRLSSCDLEKDLRGASLLFSGTQWAGRVDKLGCDWARNLWRWAGAELRRSSGVYQRRTQTRSFCRSRGNLADQKCRL